MADSTYKKYSSGEQLKDGVERIPPSDSGTPPVNKSEYAVYWREGKINTRSRPEQGVTHEYGHDETSHLSRKDFSPDDKDSETGEMNRMQGSVDKHGI